MPKPRTRSLLLATALILCLNGLATNVPFVAEAGGAARSEVPIYRNPAYAPRERATDLVFRMSLAEKAGQMNSSQSPAIPRLGVRAYGWWNEAIHGVSREQRNHGDAPQDLTNTTSYPVSLSMGSTWDPALIHQVASQTSDEAREVVRDNNLDLNIYSPTMNLSRDPRWGRNDETYSEDPNLTAKLGAQYVNGMEGKDRQGNLLPESNGYLKTSTTLKHFAANNTEYNRTTGTSNMDPRTLREYYTKQFRDVIAKSDPASIMSSYNRVNGEPASASTHLMDTLARKTFGFSGFFTSDCDSVFEIQNGHKWHPPGRDEPVDHVERNAIANAAGEDLNCNQGYHDEHNFGNTLPNAAQQGIPTPNGRYDEDFIDSSLVRLFTTRIELGEFDDPARNPWVQQARERVPRGSWENSDANNAVTQTSQRLDLTRKAADESIVMLKNDPAPNGDKLLPIRVPESGPFRVAVVGDRANPDEVYLGGYSSRQGPAGEANSVNGYEGIKAAIQAVNPRAKVDYLPGTDPEVPGKLNTESIAKSANYDTAVVYAGTDENTAKEEKDRKSLELPAPQTELINGVAKANPNTAVYLETVGQVDVTKFEPQVRSILWSSYNGQRKGEALADVLLGRHNPSGHLPFTWYRDESQLPPPGDYRIRPAGNTPGRTYQYFDGPVSFPFGHGLSYSRFDYRDLRLDRRDVDANGTATAHATVTNTAGTPGTDVVQLYATTPGGADPSQRPKKRLVGSRKVHLGAHESTRVDFPVEIRDLAFFDQRRGRFEVDEGQYGLQLASSSADADVQQQETFDVRGQLRPVPRSVSVTPRAADDPARKNASQVMYDRGTEIAPRPTVAMTDGTRRGYDAEGTAGPLQPGTTVAYRSNRPDVVATSPGGGLRTRGPGIATVTATVRDGATVKSTDFVVHVR